MNDENCPNCSQKTTDYAGQGDIANDSPHKQADGENGDPRRIQVLIEHGFSDGDNQWFRLMRVEEQIKFKATSLDREIGRLDTSESSFKAEEFRRAVDELRDRGSSGLKGIDAYESMDLVRMGDGSIKINITLYGGSFCFWAPLESLQLKD